MILLKLLVSSYSWASVHYADGRLAQDLVKTRSRDIGCYNDRVLLKFDRHLGSAADVLVKFQSDWKSVHMNLAASRLLVQAICAQKPLNQAKLSTSMKLSTMLGHHMGINFRYGAMQKIQYFYRGGHISSAITAFLIFGHISTTNWLTITNLVSNTMFSGSMIPMEPFKIQLNQCNSGITHLDHKTTLYLTHRDIWENFRAWHLQCFKSEPICLITTAQYHSHWNLQISYDI